MRRTEEEMLAIINKPPKVVSMRQARLALLNAGVLSTIENAITTGTDEAMKIEWEYATEIRRDWTSLNTLAASLEISPEDMDDLFMQARKL